MHTDQELERLSKLAFTACVTSDASLVKPETIDGMWDKINAPGKAMWARVVKAIYVEANANVLDALRAFKGWTCRDCPVPELHIAADMDAGND